MSAAAIAEAEIDDVARLRVPPHSIEAEQSLLGGLLLDSSEWPVVEEIVRADDFFQHGHRLVFAAIGSLIADGTVPDTITTFELLQREGNAEACGGIAHLNALAQSVPSAANARGYARIVREHAQRRHLIAFADGISTRAFAGDDPAALHDAAVSNLAAVDPKGIARTRVPLLRLDELRAASQAQRWLVKHAVPADAVAMLFGASGTFKSFIALDLALHVVHGLPWLGRRTMKGAVLYIAAEGGAGLWPRIEAWHRARGLRWAGVPLFVVPAAVDLSTEAWRVVSAAQAAGVTPALVIVDTLSQTYTGEENSANEMAAYLREIASRFRALWGCAVLVIHHSGHQATERPRGSSAITSNIDVLLGAHRDEKEMIATLSNPKQKDAERFADQTFSLVPVQLGIDADGDSITSLVARHLSTADEIARAIEAEKVAGRGGRTTLLMDLVQNGALERDVRRAFYDSMPFDMAPDTRKKNYYRARDAAVRNGWIEVADGYIIDLRGSK